MGGWQQRDSNLPQLNSFVYIYLCLFLNPLHLKMLYITSLYYNYSSDISDTSDINSDLYSFYSDYSSYFQIHPTISFPALTALLSLIPVLLNYRSFPYLSLVSWLSLTNLPLPYYTVLQTTSLHLSALCYINHSYFIVVLQFVNCSQIPTIQALLSV